ncbi:SMI1/KNR4 family protein [Actinomadura macrotermitis]|uniref:Knr4/Smi1-like domain-containing protein n=1 Tax=Actinomadura macrotermitis TaxID=2585200 RepID=A0A7K0BNZ2_9ACTN|nr:hypothetical protein [Actinomadura macrotermitis]MQY02920.1 hypothetical protein [Actinomadura macrotermitis]
MNRIQDDWARVAAWLSSNAPLSYARLRPGADPGRIGRLEEHLGGPLHPDHRALLEVCDGTVEEWHAEEYLEENDPGLILAGLHLLSVDGVRAVRGSGGLGAEWWRGWVPVAVNDYSAKPESGLAADPGGMLDDFALYDGTAPGTVPPPQGRTLAGHIAALAEALESGTGPLTKEWVVPGVAMDRLMWGHPAMDTIQVTGEEGPRTVPWRPVRR